MRSAGSGVGKSDPQNVRNPRKMCGSSVDAISTEGLMPTLLHSITSCLIVFPMTPIHVTLNDLELPFCVKFCLNFCAGMFGALKPGFRNLATLNSETCNECRRRTLNQEEQLRHHTVSLRRHGFLVSTTGGSIILQWNIEQQLIFPTIEPLQINVVI